MPEPDAILGAAGVVSGLGAVFVTVYMARSNKKKLNAETAKSRADAVDVLTDSASDIVVMYREELSTSRAELAEMTKKFRELTTTFEQERQASRLRIWELESMNRDLQEEIQRLNGGGK